MKTVCMKKDDANFIELIAGLANDRNKTDDEITQLICFFAKYYEKSGHVKFDKFFQAAFTVIDQEIQGA